MLLAILHVVLVVLVVHEQAWYDPASPLHPDSRVEQAEDEEMVPAGWRKKSISIQICGNIWQAMATVQFTMHFTVFLSKPRTCPLLIHNLFIKPARLNPSVSGNRPQSRL